LPKKQAEVLVLLDIEGHTREEAAEMLDVPPGTVASRLRLAREGFRKVWEETQGAQVPSNLSWGSHEP
jgi:RNA polymerase sigma-70 factor (ECF subfamily)